MKRPNNSGGIRKLSGKRRHPYQAVVSDGHVIRDNKVVVRQVSLGCYATRKEALEALGKWQAGQISTKYRDMTAADVYEKIKGNYKESVAEHMMHVYNKMGILRDMRVIDIKTDTLNSYMATLPQMSQASQNLIRRFWRDIFGFAYENDMVAKDYSKFIRFDAPLPRKEKTIFTPEEITVLKSDTMYRILLFTGMRINEFLTMPLKNIYEDEGILCFHVTKSKTSAGKRVIPVHGEILDDVKKLLKNDFRTPYEYARRRFQTFAEINHFDYHTLHDFRRTFSSYAKSCGVDEFYRKALMGHRMVDLTDRIYTQVFIQDLTKEINKITL